jgi:hypothetical protein
MDSMASASIIFEGGDTTTRHDGLVAQGGSRGAMMRGASHVPMVHEYSYDMVGCTGGSKGGGLLGLRVEDYYAAMAVGWCDGWLPAVVVGRRWFAFSTSLGANRSLSFGASLSGGVGMVFLKVLKGELGCVGCGGWVSRRDGWW